MIGPARNRLAFLLSGGLAALALHAAAVAADAPDATPPKRIAVGPGGGVLTRSFREISALEARLEDARSRNDEAALVALVFPAFAMHQPDKPVQPVLSLLSKDADLGTTRLLHVHDVGGALVAVLSSSRYGDALVTDVWQSPDGGSTWQLRLRVLPPAR